MWRNNVSIELNCEWRAEYRVIKPFMIAKMKQNHFYHIQFQSNWYCWHWSSWRHNLFVDCKMWITRGQTPKKKKFRSIIIMYKIDSLDVLVSIIFSMYRYRYRILQQHKLPSKCPSMEIPTCCNIVYDLWKMPKLSFHLSNFVDSNVKKHTPPKVAKTALCDDMIVVCTFFCFPLLWIVFFLIEHCFLDYDPNQRAHLFNDFIM